MNLFFDPLIMYRFIFCFVLFGMNRMAMDFFSFSVCCLICFWFTSYIICVCVCIKLCTGKLFSVAMCVCFYPKNLYISHVYDAQHVLVNHCVQIGSINTVVVAAYTNTLALLNFEISIHSMCDHLSVDVYRWTTMKMMMRIILVTMTKCVIEIFVEKKSWFRDLSSLSCLSLANMCVCVSVVMFYKATTLTKKNEKITRFFFQFLIIMINLIKMIKNHSFFSFNFNFIHTHQFNDRKHLNLTLSTLYRSYKLIWPKIFLAFGLFETFFSQ